MKKNILLAVIFGAFCLGACGTTGSGETVSVTDSYNKAVEVRDSVAAAKADAKAAQANASSSSASSMSDAAKQAAKDKVAEYKKVWDAEKQAWIEVLK